MAQKRMFTLTIVDSDAFLDMPLSTQALYFHLCMRADDDGFVNNPKKIQRSIGASDDDLKLLILKRFVLIFEDGVIVIKHWRMHNTLRSDRYIETTYQENKKLLKLKDNKSYALKTPQELLEVNDSSEEMRNDIPSGNQLATNWQPSGNPDKYSKEENSKVHNNMHENISNYTEFFEAIWKIIPIKKGKGRVSDAQKKKLFNIGIDEMTRCINRFIDDMSNQKRDEKYWMHGSTFLNSGYVDYLDENYESVSNESTEEGVLPWQ